MCFKKCYINKTLLTSVNSHIKNQKQVSSKINRPITVYELSSFIILTMTIIIVIVIIIINIGILIINLFYIDQIHIAMNRFGQF